jgi:lysophospholipase L1-like esterase
MRMTSLAHDDSPEELALESPPWPEAADPVLIGEPGERRRRVRTLPSRRALALMGVLLALACIAGTEIYARVGLGLGFPPLYITDPSIEYMMKPGQDLYRFGNHVLVNSYGMRSEEFAREKMPGEYRLMVYGDSVVNGGGQTGHESLATSITRRALARDGGTVSVGNVSAASWGPGNWLGYERHFGFFSADAVVLVISSHDYADNPRFLPLDPATHPKRTPVLALAEGFTRYLPRFVAIGSGTASTDGNHLAGDRFEPVADDAEVRNGMRDLRMFLQEARLGGRKVLVLQHWERSEIEKGEATEGNARIRDLCQALGIPVHSLQPYFAAALHNGIEPYRDNIHPNPYGQRLLARAILDQLGSGTGN